MEIVSRNLIDIERYTNDLREGMLSLLFGEGNGIVDKGNYGMVAHAFDRATTSALFKHLTSDQSEQPRALTGQDNAKPASRKGTSKGVGKSKGPGPAAGSQAARDRAAKAVATRAANKARKEAETNVASAAPAPIQQRTGFGGTQVSPVAQVVSRGPEGN